MREQIDFGTINVIPGRDIQIIEGIHTCVNQETKEPSQIILTATINKHKADSEVLTMPIYLPVSNYRSKEHTKMLTKFRSGEPFVAVLCENLKVFRHKDAKTNKWFYYAHATKFITVDYYLIDGGADE